MSDVKSHSVVEDKVLPPNLRFYLYLACLACLTVMLVYSVIDGQSALAIILSIIGIASSGTAVANRPRPTEVLTLEDLEDI